MIGELAARRRGNQVHVTPVSPGIDCGSRARTPLLSTRFGGRKLIMIEPSMVRELSVAMPTRLTLLDCTLMVRRYCRCVATIASRDEFIPSRTGFHPARGESGAVCGSCDL